MKRLEYLHQMGAASAMRIFLYIGQSDMEGVIQRDGYIGLNYFTLSSSLVQRMLRSEDWTEARATTECWWRMNPGRNRRKMQSAMATDLSGKIKGSWLSQVLLPWPAQ